MSTMRMKSITWRDTRPHMLIQMASHTDTYVELSGYLRGTSLCAGHLIHVPDIGDYPIISAIGTLDPCAKNSHASVCTFSLINNSTADLERFGTSSTPNDQDLGGMDEEDEPVATHKTLARVPRGTGPYQAAWINSDKLLVDEDGDEDGDAEMASENGSENDDGMDVDDDDEEDDEDDESADDDDDGGDDDISVNDDVRDLPEHPEVVKTRQDLCQDDKLYPDEVDTPIDAQARQRFQNYRGLKSFKNADWDPFENLPLNYGRIFRFENFQRAARVVMKEAGNVISDAEPGLWTTIKIQVPPTIVLEILKNAQRCYVLSALLKHEQRVSVVHYKIKRTLMDENVIIKVCSLYKHLLCGVCMLVVDILRHSI